MSSHASLVLFEGITSLAAALTAAKLLHSGLQKRYTAFFWYLVLLTFVSVLPLVLDWKSVVYYVVWFACQPLGWLLYVLVVRELCDLVLQKHQGLLTLGRWGIYFGTAISVVISGVILLVRIPSSGHQWHTTRILNMADRSITLCLLLFLMVMMYLLRNYPVQLSRNVVLHAGLFTLFFICNSVVALLFNLFGSRMYDLVNTALMAISAMCVLGWLFFLNPAGEDVRIMVPQFTPEQEERILYQLNALNAAMLRIAGK
jgi:hypothetical protein